MLERNVISVENVSFNYSLENDTASSSKKALDNISFSIEQGTYTAIVGTNGSGKSTICKLICGLLPLQTGKIDIVPDLRIGLVFQSPKDQIVSSKVYRDTAFGPQNLKLPASEVELRTIECLSTVELLEKAEEPTDALSLGQTQKLAMAGILAVWPDILILDEAVSMIDPQSRKCIFEFLRFWHKKGNTVIHITHDLEAIKEAEQIIGMENGGIFFNGKTDEFFKDELLVQKIIGLPLKKNDRTTFYKNVENLEKTFSFDGIDFSYDSGKKFLENISFDLYKGTLTALTGPSGAGKSTILELGAGLLSPSQGIISCSDHPSLAQQNSSAALFEAFAADDVAFGPRNMGVCGKELKNLVRNSMDKAGLPFDEYGERQSALLSGGEQRRLSLAGIIAMNKDVIFFDEPTAGLDGIARHKVMMMMKNLALEGKTVLFTTHKTDEADFSDREIKIDSGKIIEDSFDAKKQSITENENLNQMNAYESASMLKSLNNASYGVSGSGWKIKRKIEKLAPIVRIILFLFLFIASLALNNIYLCSLMFVISLIYCKAAEFSLKKLIKAFLKILPFLCIFAVLQIIFRQPLADEVKYTTWKWFCITPSKIIFCISSILKTYSAVSCISAFFISMPEYDLIDGLMKIIPSRSFSLIMEVIFRFIPLLIDESSVIIKTQIIRGSFGKAKGKIQKIRGFLPLIVPLLIRTIKRSEALSQAIVMRCFNEK